MLRTLISYDCSSNYRFTYPIEQQELAYVKLKFYIFKFYLPFNGNMHGSSYKDVLDWILLYKTFIFKRQIQLGLTEMPLCRNSSANSMLNVFSNSWELNPVSFLKEKLTILELHVLFIWRVKTVRSEFRT